MEKIGLGLFHMLLDISAKDPPHLVLCNSVVPDEAMPFVYSHAKAFTLLSRGEGWGLPYCEAAACGIPIIGSFHGGQAAFLREEDSFLVKPDRVVNADPSMFWSDLYEGTRFVDYSDVVIDEAAEKMRYVYEHYTEAKQKAETCRKRITSEFTWDKSAKKMYNRIIELQS
jgi:glycosyltransferase involved in cell wall biosynthesis